MYKATPFYVLGQYMITNSFTIYRYANLNNIPLIVFPLFFSLYKLASKNPQCRADTPKTYNK